MAMMTFGVGTPGGLGRWVQQTSAPSPAAGEVAISYKPAADTPLPSPFKISTDGKSIVPIGSAEAAAMAALLSEADCLLLVDTKAGQLRLAQITSVPGQADIYRRKQAEVDKMSTLGGSLPAILSALNLMTEAARATAYPLLTIEMQVMGYSDLTKAYSYVRAAIDATNVKLNAIEKARRAAKNAVRAATTLAAKNAASSGASWPA